MVSLLRCKRPYLEAVFSDLSTKIKIFALVIFRFRINACLKEIVLKFARPIGRPKVLGSFHKISPVGVLLRYGAKYVPPYQYRSGTDSFHRIRCRDIKRLLVNDVRNATEFREMRRRDACRDSASDPLPV
jgi:hypothetical protein